MIESCAICLINGSSVTQVIRLYDEPNDSKLLAPGDETAAVPYWLEFGARTIGWKQTRRETIFFKKP